MKVTIGKKSVAPASAVAYEDSAGGLTSPEGHNKSTLGGRNFINITGIALKLEVIQQKD